MRTTTTLRVITLCALAALLPAVGAVAQNTGSADFSRYVSLGDSLTAGFMSAGLVDQVQAHSYPRHIHTQATGGATFEQPTVSVPGLPPLLQLRSLSPLVIAPPPGIGGPTNLQLPRPYDNLAVPGATVDDLLNTVTDGGGLHDLILRGLGTQLQQALALQPTFVTLWIGNNDALAAATSGLVIDGVTLTAFADFEARYRAITSTLAGAGVQMALANIPDVTAIPFVTTIPPIVVNPATNQPVLINGSPVPLIGPGGPLQLGVDYVLLTATAELALGHGIPQALGGSGQPLSNQSVLSGAEAATINNRVAQYNQLIGAVASATGSALVDINRIFGRISRDGLVLGGIDFDAAFLTGGLFSYDGVHATPLGYAIVANAFIDAINVTYGGSIPRVGLGPYVFGPFAQVGTGLGASVAGMKFTRAAEDQLRFGLGIPDRKTLARIARGDGGGGNGGGGNGGGGGTQGCDLPPGHGKYCDFCGPCAFGVGDCDLNKPDQCQAGLSCVQDVGADFGFGPKIDVCM